MSGSRFGSANKDEIKQAIEKSIPRNTAKSKKCAWTQFLNFCKERGYVLSSTTTNKELADILEDWAFNMKKADGQDYKEYTVKTLWNITAKLLQEKYYNEYGRKFNPFEDIEFHHARAAKTAKRKLLQEDPTKRKTSASALNRDEINAIIDSFDENTPDGLQKKFFHVASHQLAWKGGEASSCLVDYFTEVTLEDGRLISNRIEYNPASQGGGSESKWLVQNLEHPERCPVRLFQKLKEKRGKMQITRFFLAPDPYWNKTGCSNWYKNSPVGRNTMSLWTKEAASSVGIDVKKRKITHQSNISSTVANLGQRSVNEQEIKEELPSNIRILKVETVASAEDATIASSSKMDDNCSDLVALEGEIREDKKSINYINCTFYTTCSSCGSQK